MTGLAVIVIKMTEDQSRCLVRTARGNPARDMTYFEAVYNLTVSSGGANVLNSVRLFDKPHQSIYHRWKGRSTAKPHNRVSIPGRLKLPPTSPIFAQKRPCKSSGSDCIDAAIVGARPA